MFAAIYARKSTEQAGVADDQKSVTRQVEHARAFAAAKGWTVADCIFVDDGISGAEFANRPGSLRLMNAMSRAHRSRCRSRSKCGGCGAESIESTYALTLLSIVAVRFLSYLVHRNRTLDSPTEKVMRSLTCAPTRSSDVQTK